MKQPATHRRPLRALAATLCAAALTASALAPVQRTSRGRLRPAPAPKTETPAPFDTLRSGCADAVVLTGYDKPLASAREALFVTNRLASPLVRVYLTITYLDERRRTLHARSVAVTADVPPGETRRIEFPTWDTQHTFYYRHGRVPSAQRVTPYDVSCTVDSLIIHH